MELYKPDDCKVVIKERLKNNGKLFTGISLSNSEIKCVPTVYLEQLYEYFLDGRKISGLVEDYISLFERSRNMTVPQLDFLSDFEKVKRVLLCKVINTEMNRELLKAVPHFSFLNLSVVFFVNVPIEEEKNSFVMIENEMFKHWGVDIKLAYEYARYNTFLQYAVSISPIEEVLFGMMSKDISDADRAEIRATLDNVSGESGHFMYVLSNEERMNGAVGILDGERLAEFASEINDDFYILPSSVHELILVPVYGSCSKEELKDMVCQVNESEVSPEDVLADTVYLYSRKQGSVCIA